MEELDIIIKTHDNWPDRIMVAEACAYQDSNHGVTSDYVKLKQKYIQYMLDKFKEELEHRSEEIFDRASEYIYGLNYVRSKGVKFRVIKTMSRGKDKGVIRRTFYQGKYRITLTDCVCYSAEIADICLQTLKGIKEG